jgi:dynactin complex subunit
MSQNIQELTDKIWRSVTQDAYDTNDISALINVALILDGHARTLTEKVENLEAERARHVEALGVAIKDNDKLRSALDKYEHLTQFAEEVEQ